jgi:DNA-binding GntR family transcriptional regulator
VNQSVTAPAEFPLQGAHESLTDFAYASIRKRLVTLAIAPGQVFSEGQLAAEFQISKTPVREALARLQHDGLVEVEPRAGYRAVPITVGGARDLLDLRILLEGESTALAAERVRAGTADRKLIEMIESLSQLSYDPDNRASIWRYLETNTTFHLGIAQIAGNKYLTDALERVFASCERLLHAGMALTTRQRDVLTDHRDIVEAVLGGDPEVGRAVGRRQAMASRDLIVEALLSSASILSAWIEIPEDRRREPAGK